MSRKRRLKGLCRVHGSYKNEYEFSGDFPITPKLVSIRVMSTMPAVEVYRNPDESVLAAARRYFAICEAFSGAETNR